jgi:hypothetical protein
MLLMRKGFMLPTLLFTLVLLFTPMLFLVRYLIQHQSLLLFFLIVIGLFKIVLFSNWVFIYFCQFLFDANWVVKAYPDTPIICFWLFVWCRHVVLNWGSEFLVGCSIEHYLCGIGTNVVNHRSQKIVFCLNSTTL